MANPSVGRNRNTNRSGGGSTSIIALNTATAVDVFTFLDSTIFLNFSNSSVAHCIWIRPFPASVKPTSQEGILLGTLNSGTSNFSVPPDHPNVDGWSAIAMTDTPDIYVTSW